MNMSRFTLSCAQKCGKDIKEIESVFVAIKETLLEGLCQGEEIKLKGFGKFFVKVLPPKTIINNFTGKENLVMQRFRVAFKSSKKLNEKIK